MSDESLRKAGRAELDRLNKSKPGALSDSENRKAKPPRKQVTTTASDLLGIGKKKSLRRVDQLVDEAVENAKPDSY